jgi:cation:H+ antiporter
MVLAAFGLIALAADSRLTTLDGALLLTAAVAYTVAIIWFALGEARSAKLQFAREFKPPIEDRRTVFRESVWNLALLSAGIAVILVGAGWFVDGAVGLARVWGVSDAFIGVTVVALGTTSPELATTIISMLKKQRDIGLGNLLGSCVYNILLILGAACLASGGGIALSLELLRLDLPVMALTVLVCVPVFLTGRRVSRLEGGTLVAGYAVFLGYLILTRT